ncbi:MAG: triphosphoribosyl-dephospho-CoA synthase [Candidatus Bathyarchaeota archaeon]|nr:triphosphoribosyl-dephospho-CoA synthase [Candidatus Bathyarchaeota archaeon]
MTQKPSDKALHISKCLELAILFEISADKPGNVNLTTGFESTRYEHFLVSAVAAAPWFRHAAEKGIACSEGRIRLGEIGVGELIKQCVADIDQWQKGGNTLLGTVILLMPIAVAAGMTPQKDDGSFKISELRENVGRVVRSTTSEDAVAVYRAIEIARPSGLNKVPELDVNDPASVNKIMERGISLYQVFEIGSKWDSVCAEWVKNYPVTFDVAYPFLMQVLREDGNLNTAVIHAFLKVLSENPDTFIARKIGINKAEEVSSAAKQVLALGGLKTEEGKKKLHEFDLKLRSSNNLLNPGTTADIVAAALSLCVLGGYRP